MTEARQRGTVAAGAVLSVLLVEKGPGFTVSRDLPKLGYKGVESCELHFDGYRCPSDAVLGGVPGHGFAQMMQGSPEAWKSMSAAYSSMDGDRTTYRKAMMAAAKKIVFGDVGIDSIAGPSEVFILSDGGVDPVEHRLESSDLLRGRHRERSRPARCRPEVDHVGAGVDGRTIVNWSVASDKIDASIDSVKEEVHEATAPDTPPSTPSA